VRNESNCRARPRDLMYQVRLRVGWAAGAVLVWGILSTVVAALPQESPSPVTGLQRNIMFTEYTPLSGNVELAHRTLSPLVNIEIKRASEKSPLRAQAIDLAQERFVIYVPVKRPPRGFGLLSFIPPWQDALLPPGWAEVLDQSGVIFVSAAKSGNEEHVTNRRMPLALLGAYNIMRRYPIDPERVYVGGFSGGARVAMKVALAYPDLFRGALLNAGSDPIGGRDALIPPDDLFRQFQSSSRLVYTTGSEDSLNIQLDMVSRGSMTEWCVFGTSSVQTMFRAGHEVAAPDSLRRALTALDREPTIDGGKLFACRARIAKEMEKDLRNVQELLDHHKPRNAWRALSKIDVRYGGLASPQIIEFEQRIGSH
jgi:pimeloyl-ACP methyl ester carboxylesterase